VFVVEREGYLAEVACAVLTKAGERVKKRAMAHHENAGLDRPKGLEHSLDVLCR